ncbi:hypothetical protein Nmel_014056 [Mimus melanotis]
MMSWALSRAGEPHSLGIFPRFYPRGANAFAPSTSPISTALWGQPAGRNWLCSSHCPCSMTHSARQPGRGCPGVPSRPCLPALPDGAGPAGPALSGCGLVNGPDNAGTSSAALLLSLPAPRPLASPCSHIKL